MTEETALRSDARGLAVVRLIIGLVQGLALYLLYSAFDAKMWPATSGYAFAPLVLVSVFIPLLLTQAFGNLRTRTLIVWAMVATALIAGLAWYDIWRAWPWEYTWQNSHQVAAPHIIPSFGVVFFTAIGLFIAQALVAGGDADRRFMASYPTHFDVAWKLALQLMLSAVFVGAFWLLLWLGSELFQLIGLHFLERLIEHAWFAIPVTALATAMALHVTDVRAALVRGARTLVLVLLAWLLPVMALFALGFMLSLPFTGLDLLWQTKSAAAILLIAAAALVILINATYQDGENEHHAVPLILRYAARAAAVVLVPIVALAIYAITLRVRQYGWTVDRVSSVAVAAVAFGYAAGYALAAMLPGVWMQRIERWNFAMALVVLATLFILFTPIADPARISVASQLARLQTGTVPPERFDFNFLRYQGERFGYDALTMLRSSKTGPKAAFVRTAADDALHPKFGMNAAAPTPSMIAQNVTVYPKGQSLPVALIRQHWEYGDDVPPCLVYTATRCDAFLADINGDGVVDILFVQGGVGTFAVNANVLAVDAKGVWHAIGHVVLPPCSGLYEALKAGRITSAPSNRRDVVVNGIALPFAAAAPRPEDICPK